MSENSTAARPSLRERKREQTWHAIHEAAARLALAHDQLADVSVDTIAEQANISQRTFFNYFGSKEDAILGQRPPEIDDELAAGFVLEEGDDLVEKVAFLLISVFRDATAGSGPEQRRALMRKHDVLVRKGMAHVEDVRHLVQDLVVDRLAEQPRWRGSPDLDDAAQLVILTASAVMRVAVPKLINASDPAEETVIVRGLTHIFQEVTRPTP
ncbi:TetR/AcrR family transcriptional regulator [Tomitella biformata]|uniref:TetR/AcrR family transcriptional regulator n=1 Tax=Tomitella biformata TaxID=630403 RepID=UPI0004641475|nr:TetR/AcrR family transcriptional regulator [Tomitella biformata]